MGSLGVEACDFLRVLNDPHAVELLLLSCPDGVLAAGPDDCVLLYGGACESLFGYAPSEVLRTPAGRLFAPGEFERLKGLVRANGSAQNAWTTCVRADGSPFPASVSAAPIADRYGGGASLILYVRDRTREEELRRELASRNERLGELVLRLNEAARRDPLTNLLHRAAGLELAEERFLEARASDRPFGVVIFDCDRFKGINDVYGHLVGDEVLRLLARVLTEECRKGDIVARFGGEEFIVFLPGADCRAAAAFAERVRRRVERHRWQVGGVQLRFTISGGVASVPDCAATLTEAIHVADMRLLAAKRAGRNRVIGQPNEEKGGEAA